MRLSSFCVFVALLGFTGCSFNFFSGDGAEEPAKDLPAAGAEGNGVAPDRTAVGGLQPHEMDQLDGATDGAAVEAFYAKGFHYCDAVMLAGLWQVDTWEAKVKAGGMAQRYEVDVLNTSVDSARSATRDGRVQGCSWDNLVSSGDLDILGMYWGEKDISELKARVERKAAWGQFGILEQELASARANALGEGPEDDGNEEMWRSAFFDSPKADYCHAKMLSAAWGQSVSESKTTIGYKLYHGLYESLEMAKDAARQHAQSHPAARCSFGETDFTTADAQKLAGMWSVSLDEAKAALASKYTYGLEDSIRSELRG